MKKLLALLLALAMCLAMFACGETEDKKDKNDKDEEVEAEIAELEEELEDLEAELEEAKEDEDDELIEELEEKIEKIEKKIDKLKDGDKDEDEEDEDEDKKKDDEEEDEDEETKKPSEKPSKNDEEAQTTAPAPETTPAPVTTDYVWWEDEPEDTYVWWEDEPEDTYVWWEDDEPAYTEAYTTDDEWYYDEPEEDDGAASFSEALTEFKGILDIMESGDVEAYAAASGGDTSELDPMSYAVVECMLKNFEYTLGDAYEGSDTGSVEVTITNINTFELTYALIAEVENCETEEEMMAAMVTYLNGTVPTFTETVTVYFEKTNNGWVMDEYASADFASVIAGMPIEE